MWLLCKKKTTKLQKHRGKTKLKKLNTNAVQKIATPRVYTQLVLPLDYISIVGDSPEGPLKQPGESCLKPAKKQNETPLT
jgi:hypothetical protein